MNSNIFSVNRQGDLSIDVNVDTEFTHPASIINPYESYCTNISVQFRERSQTKGIIYTHPDIAELARHKVFEHEFSLWNYLLDLGVNFRAEEVYTGYGKDDYPLFIVNLYAFFALAEIKRIFRGSLLNIIDDHLKNRKKNYGIEMSRRLYSYTHIGKPYFDYFKLPRIVYIDKKPYRLALSIKDVSAIAGKCSYKDLAAKVGFNLKYKDSLKQHELENMLSVYINQPQKFDNYALGDLYCTELYDLFAEKFYLVYESLSLSDYFESPRLTIGSTVSKLFESSLHSLFGIHRKKKEIIKQYCYHASADYLKRENRTRCLLGKVDGGRCRNNRPTDIHAEGIIIDIDIMGCYAEGLRSQLYPLGRPVYIDYPRGFDNNSYHSLRDFLKVYNSELVPGLWQARVSLKDNYFLKYQQDFLASWIPPNNLKLMVTDSESEAVDQWWKIENVGIVKIFKNEIKNAVITHDFIQWLDNVATPRQRKELLDNLVVIAASFYPASCRVNTIEDLEDAYNNYDEKSYTKFNFKKGFGGVTENITDLCHAWYGVNMGDLIVDNLLLERKKHSKKSPLNELFKLTINTIYGDMVSPFFHIGNSTVGNNITARARAMAWYMEKGFFGFPTITDGCAFDLTQVPVSIHDRKLTGENTVNAYLDDVKKKTKFKNLALEAYNLYFNTNLICISYSEFKTAYNCMDAINADINCSFKDFISAMCIKHLQSLSSNVNVLHLSNLDVYKKERLGLFQLECKGVFEEATFHGAANYNFSPNDDNAKMRSYSQKPKKAVDYVNGKLEVINDKYIPSNEFLRSLKKPTRVPRSLPFIEERILKLNDYRNNQESYSDSRAYPGTTIYSPRILREFSLSQFTFNTYKQFLSWRKQSERFKNKYGQSYEMFFLNEDDTLNFQLMVDEIELLIRQGDNSFRERLRDKNRNDCRGYLNHCGYESLEAAKEAVATLLYYDTAKERKEVNFEIYKLDEDTFDFEMRDDDDYYC